jgi:hypothetical protein
MQLEVLVREKRGRRMYASMKEALSTDVMGVKSWTRRPKLRTPIYQPYYIQSCHVTSGKSFKLRFLFCKKYLPFYPNANCINLSTYTKREVSSSSC